MTEPTQQNAADGAEASATHPDIPADLTVPFADGVTVAPGQVAAVETEPDEGDFVKVDIVFETVLIMPGEGQDLGQLARELIDLASHPHEVEWRPRVAAFEVPAALAQAYAQAVGGSLEETAPAKKAVKSTPARKGVRTAKTSKKEGGTSG